MTRHERMEKIVSLAQQWERQEPETGFLLKRLRRHHPETYRISIRTAFYALELALAMQYSEQEARMLYRTALLHDIGKLHLSREHLQNRHRLYDEALWTLQQHPKVSAELLDAYIKEGAVDGEAVLYHHENLDGTGYPFGVTWNELSLNARILRIASNFAEMTEGGSALGRTTDEALEELYCWSDVLFDPDLVDLMNLLYKEPAGHRREGKAHDLIKRN